MTPVGDMVGTTGFRGIQLGVAKIKYAHKRLLQVRGILRSILNVEVGSFKLTPDAIINLQRQMMNKYTEHR